MSTDSSMDEFDAYFKQGVFLNLKTIPPDGVRGTIVSTAFETMANTGERKPRALITADNDQLWMWTVNPTNGAVLNAMYGRGFRYWEGKPIVLVAGKTKSPVGSMVDSIVIDRDATRKILAGNDGTTPPGNGSTKLPALERDAVIIHPGDEDCPF